MLSVSELRVFALEQRLRTGRFLLRKKDRLLNDLLERAQCGQIVQAFDFSDDISTEYDFESP